MTYLDAEPLIAALAGQSLWLHRCQPRDGVALLAHLPRGTEHVAIWVAGPAHGQVAECLVFADRRAPGWPATRLSEKAAAEQLKLWLHLRRAGEVECSPGWGELLAEAIAR